MLPRLEQRLGVGAFPVGLCEWGGGRLGAGETAAARGTLHLRATSSRIDPVESVAGSKSWFGADRR